MGPCPFGDSVSPDGPPVPGDLQARPFRAEKLTAPIRKKVARMRSSCFAQALTIRKG